MHFPIWQYLNQPLWDRDHPSMFNPLEYWRCYRRHYLNCCLHNAFLERCWDTNYQDFVVHYRDFCNRDPLEEDPHWLAERCWYSEMNRWTYEHPENQISETEC
ncbi:MAG: hypothetical protein AAFW75_00465 [Cyanobacteria bacterium J06636_16]